jgi:acyl-[acyl-carrier-protein]-phospholipid O-acyltransferase/long-chain-fatty-acid--[acyl-carrier-protein] ligase
MKVLLRLLLRIWFRFRAENTAVLDTPGPVLLLPNHVSWLDWAFLGAVLDDDWRFVTSSTTAQTSWIHRRVMINRRTFPVDPASPYAAKRMAEFLAQGGRLVLFPEGRISVTARMMKLFDGTGFLIHKTGAKVITCYLRNAVRVPVVRHTGWTEWFPRVSVHFSAVLTAPRLTDLSNTVARQRITVWLRDRMVEQQFQAEMERGPDTVLAAIAETASKLPGKAVLEDITQKPLTYRRLMVGTELLASQFSQFAPRFSEGRNPGPQNIGVLLPNVNGMPVTLLALWANELVPAILNFSTGIPVLLQCAQLAGLRDILTSRAFLEKAKLDVTPMVAAGIRFHYLEDIRQQIGGLEKLIALAKHTLSCGWGFRSSAPPSPDTRRRMPAVVLFTSGSEGVPKGVVLTHRNLLANIRQMDAFLEVTDHERFFNALPLFHSFGLTACTLLPLVRGLYTFLYPSPLHYRVVPAVVYDKNCTVMVGTNTFLNGYARKAAPYDFQSVKYLVAGAEKVQEATAQTWARKFGIRLLEGYGATECSPVLCANNRIEARFGSVGRFMPGMESRLEPVEGVSEIAPDGRVISGRLFVRGPNVMAGYLNADANAKFLELDGWYDTGDLARVDDDGFVFLLGRMKRFAKISGEMVSLTAVEDALAGAFPQHGLRCEVAVVALPDEDKGEKLVAIANVDRLSLDEIRQAIKAKGLTNLCIPKDLRYVHEIPKLGTGKVNHRALMEEVRTQTHAP